MMERWMPRALDVFDEAERMMEGVSESPRVVWWRRTPSEGISWSPAVCMYEKEDGFTVRAEVPGLTMNEIDISLTGDTLTIKGERKAPEGVKEEELSCCEVCYGPFSRSITLTSRIDRSKIEAMLENGILEIKLPKSPEEIPAKIQVKAKQAKAT
ncbi:MAG: Hsp20/alpha crystallin family protein [Chloroflexi bacterium]|nr:Hsp20/alpha crystallin family protein [Chloroflexota bacterium]